jgi:hypothetical protein
MLLKDGQNVGVAVYVTIVEGQQCQRFPDYAGSGDYGGQFLEVQYAKALLDQLNMRFEMLRIAAEYVRIKFAFITVADPMVVEYVKMIRKPSPG